MQNWFSNIFLSWKTTGVALIGGIALILKAFNIVDITPEQQVTLVTAIAIIVGFLAKDANVSGTVEDHDPVEGTVTEDNKGE